MLEYTKNQRLSKILLVVLVNGAIGIEPDLALLAL
jgi:hypothetical protein